MKKLVLYFSILVLFHPQSMAQESVARQPAPTCNAEPTLSRVYTAINRFMCFNLFYNGEGAITSATGAGMSNPDNRNRAEANTNCSLLILGGAAAVGTAGVVASQFTTEGVRARSETYRAMERQGGRRLFEHRLRYENSNLQEIPPTSQAYLRSRDVHRTLRMNREQYAALRARSAFLSSRSLRILDPRIVRGMTGLAAVAVFTFGAAVLDASPAGCSEIIHMYTDYGPNCEYRPELGPNTQRFLELSAEEQRRIMSEDPRICSAYTQFAEKLEADLNTSFPQPEFTVTSCSPAGEVTGVNLSFASGPYPNGGGAYNITTTRANTLSIDSVSPSAADYDLDLTPGAFGVASISRLSAKVRGGLGVTRRFTAAQLLADAGQNADRRIYLEQSVRALHGYQAVRAAVGNQCASYLQVDAPAAGAAPAIGQ